LLVSADQAKAVVREKEYQARVFVCVRSTASRDRGSPDPEPVQIAGPIEPGPEQRPPVVDVLFGSPVVRLVVGSTQRSPFA
jgi:hypothetical protein